MKKLVPVLLIVVIVFNFILCNYVYADLDDVTRDISRYGGNETIKSEAAQTIVDRGTDSSGNTLTHSNFGVSIMGVVFQTIASVVNAYPIIIQAVLSIFTLNPDSSQIAGTTISGATGFWDGVNRTLSLVGASAYHYSIERTVFNEISILNINVFNQSDSYTNGTGEHTETIFQHPINLELKKSVAGWFYTIRLIAMMINLCVLIYIGIRMALSSVASEEARYKRMLLWWVESMIVLFCLQYIMYAIIFVGDVMLNIINVLRFNVIANNGAVSFEDMIINRIYLALIMDGGTQFFLYSLFFWFLTALQVKFFFTYLKRMFTIFFLVVISPLITVTYPLDKLGNGRAEAFEIWLKELIINIAIQPIHAIVYLVFVYTAGQIATKAPWVAMIFLLVLGRIENIIRNVFKITDSVDNVNAARKPGGQGVGIVGMVKMFMGK